jgi:predicted component of type VI protein secretion system
MDYKSLSNLKERFIVKRLSYRIFLNKEAKYYAINKNDKSPTFTNRTDLNRWIKNRIEELRDQQTSNQAELF